MLLLGEHTSIHEVVILENMFKSCYPFNWLERNSSRYLGILSSLLYPYGSGIGSVHDEAFGLNDFIKESDNYQRSNATSHLISQKL